MRIILLSLIFISLCFNPHFSKGQCATEPLDSASFESQPWFASPAYLINLRDSLNLDVIANGFQKKTQKNT